MVNNYCNLKQLGASQSILLIISIIVPVSALLINTNHISAFP